MKDNNRKYLDDISSMGSWKCPSQEMQILQTFFFKLDVERENQVLGMKCQPLLKFPLNINVNLITYFIYNRY